MGRRRLGRETAFKALYRIDVTGKDLEDALGGLAEDRDTDPEALGFARDLLETVGAHGIRLDRVLQAAAEHWTLERMAVVDRSILRLGSAEILYWPWIPDRVSIDEYVEIAKKFGTEESPRFVNAILDRVAREAREDAGKEAGTGAEEAE
ncbi:MAG: transcription antitermination factor NusB [bacterium]